MPEWDESFSHSNTLTARETEQKINMFYGESLFITSVSRLSTFVRPNVVNSNYVTDAIHSLITFRNVFFRSLFFLNWPLGELQRVNRGKLGREFFFVLSFILMSIETAWLTKAIRSHRFISLQFPSIPLMIHQFQNVIMDCFKLNIVNPIMKRYRCLSRLWLSH